ncbi:MAG: NAD(P)-dependent oxidoreductase [Gemmatimonadetes bacterium]|nr:NAD(P)-dependent oxidoreductase [Gemmatimonadota bacterium]
MPLDPSRTVVGFIGTGVMGRSMARNLVGAGYRVLVYTRTPAKAAPVLEAGAEWRDAVADVARESDVVITMVGYPADVEEVYLGERGILASARPGAYVVDMTTSKPSLARRIYEEAAGKGIRALDAPVSGGDVGAREARLSIMVGGDEDAFEAVRPVLEALGKNIVYQGPAGAGQHTKMANQIAIASGMIGVCEALAYARRAGLDPWRVLQSIETGAAASWSLSNYGPRMLRGDFEPGFYVKHFLKDMGIALEAAEEMDLDLPGLELARMLYDEVAEIGFAEKGTQSLFVLWEEDEGDDAAPDLVQLTRR